MSTEFKCVISLRNAGALIGNYYCDGYVCAYSILEYIRVCIENYNRNLTDPHIPMEVLSHRFFDVENFDCNLHTSHALIMPGSYKHAKENYVFYKWPGLSSQNPRTRIALIPTDMNIIDGEKNCGVQIWLNEHSITTYKLFDNFIAREYCELKGIDEADFDEKKLTETSINPRLFTFNELEDLMEIAGDSDNGFKYSGDSHLIWMPRTYKKSELIAFLAKKNME